MKKLIAILVILLFLIYGCTEAKQFGEKYKSYDLTFSIEKKEKSDNDVCMALECEKKKKFFFFTEKSLYETKCEFKPIDLSEYNKLVSGDNKYIRTFSIGAGPSYYSFEKTSFFVGGKMNTLVKWLKGGLSGYTIPPKERTICYLKHDVQPIFVLYGKVDLDSTKKIAEEMNGIGPVIIITKPDLDENQKQEFGLIKNQINIIKTNCPNCLVGLAVKFGDMAVLEDFKDTNYDIVAFGIKPEELNKDQFKISVFIKNISLYYGKPSLIYYFYTTKDEKENYLETFRNIPLYAKEGLIGINLYSIYGGGPLNCNCELKDPYTGEEKESFDDVTKAIKIYYGGGIKGGINLITNVFPSGMARCDFAFNPDYMNFFKEDSEGLHLLNAEFLQPNMNFFSCLKCLHKERPSPNLLYFSIENGYICDAHDVAIGLAGDNYDIDLVLFRSILWEEGIENNNYEEIAEKFNDAYDYAKSYVEINKESLNIDKDEEKQYWYAVFFALDRYFYNGKAERWSGWWSDYISPDNHCSHGDFFYFVYKCEYNENFKPFNVISRYFSLIDQCDGICSDEKDVYKELCSSNQLPENCCSYSSYEDMCKDENCKKYC